MPPPGQGGKEAGEARTSGCDVAGRGDRELKRACWELISYAKPDKARTLFQLPEQPAVPSTALSGPTFRREARLNGAPGLLVVEMQRQAALGLHSGPSGPGGQLLSLLIQARRLPGGSCRGTDSRVPAWPD